MWSAADAGDTAPIMLLRNMFSPYLELDKGNYVSPLRTLETLPR